MKMTTWYVYAYWDLEGVPRYIGIGKNAKRIESHLKYSHNRLLHNKIKKLQRAGLEMAHRKLTEGLTKSQACAEEIRLIALYGRLKLDPGGVLFNRTLGGEGFTGAHSSHTRKRMSDAHKGKVFTEEHRANLSKARAGVPLTDEWRRNSSIGHLGQVPWNKGKKTGQNPWPTGKRPGFIPWNKGVACTEEMKARISATLTGRKLPPEVIAKVAAATRGRKRSIETRERMRVAQLKRYATRGERAPEQIQLTREICARARAVRAEKISARKTAKLQLPDISAG
jgi:NUMOD3 motif